jgi:outer membrane protein assembly factor BamB
MKATDHVYAGIKGSVLALSRTDGSVVWQARLKGSSYVALASMAPTDTEILASTNGEVFCLDAATGALRWHNPLRGWGTGLTFLMVPGAAPDPQTGQMAEFVRRAEAQRAASASAAAASS